jgi:hypothetical protein
MCVREAMRNAQLAIVRPVAAPPLTHPQFRDQQQTRARRAAPAETRKTSLPTCPPARVFTAVQRFLSPLSIAPTQSRLASARAAPARISPTYITALTTLSLPQTLHHPHPRPPLSKPSGPFHTRKSNKKIQKITHKSPFDAARQTTRRQHCRLLSTVLRPAPTSPLARRRTPRARLSAVQDAFVACTTPHSLSRSFLEVLGESKRFFFLLSLKRVHWHMPACACPQNFYTARLTRRADRHNVFRRRPRRDLARAGRC